MPDARRVARVGATTGLVGVGWGLSGFSTVQRANRGMGTPRFGDTGLITGGTSLPARTFTYQNDSLGKTFQAWESTPSRITTEPVNWARKVNIVPSGSGNSLTKTAGVDFGILEDDQLYVYENGVQLGAFARADGDVLRIEVAPGVVSYKRNGQVLHASAKVPTYPLRADASIRTYTTIKNVAISGLLQEVAGWWRLQRRRAFGPALPDQPLVRGERPADDGGRLRRADHVAGRRRRQSRARRLQLQRQDGPG